MYAAARPWMQSPLLLVQPRPATESLSQGKVVPARLSLVPYQQSAAKKQQVEVSGVCIFRQLYSRLT